MICLPGHLPKGFPADLIVLEVLGVTLPAKIGETLPPPEISVEGGEVSGS